MILQILDDGVVREGEYGDERREYEESVHFSNF
jgi:hypothetical protein